MTEDPRPRWPGSLRTALALGPGFNRVWLASSLSDFGTYVTMLALPLTGILVLGLRPLELSGLLIAEIGAGILAGIVAGTVADRLDLRRAMVLSDVVRFGALAAVPAAHWSGVLSYSVLLVVATLVGGFSSLFFSAYRAVLPAMVAPTDLIGANSRLQATSSGGELVGWSIGGVLVQALSAPVAILLDSVTYFLSALTLRGLPSGAAASVDTDHGADESFWGAARAGFSQTLRRSDLRALGLLALGLGAFGNIFGAVYLYYLSQQLHLDASVLGVLFAVGGGSALVGAALTGRAVRRLGVYMAIAVGALIAGVARFFVPLAAGGTAAVLIVLALQQMLGDGAQTSSEIARTSYLQERVPERQQTRVHATFRLIDQSAMLIGILVGGVLGQLAGLRIALLVSAIGTTASALALVLYVRWRPGPQDSSTGHQDDS